MKKMTSDDVKNSLLGILKYVDDICQKNNINYSLLGGSLIGAIRHQGFIPWDDDVDIILEKEETERLIEAIKADDNKRYKLYIESSPESYFYPYPKIVDTNTSIKYENRKQIENYGVSLDVFTYTYAPDDDKLRKKHYYRVARNMSLLTGYYKNVDSDPNLFKRFLKYGRKFVATIIGKERLLKMYKKECEKYSNKKSNYYLSNWPVYGIKKEYQESSVMQEFMRVDFENIKASISKDYDKILKTTFGDYMKLPDEKDRKTHGLTAYWKE